MCNSLKQINFCIQTFGSVINLKNAEESFVNRKQLIQKKGRERKFYRGNEICHYIISTMLVIITHGHKW